MNTFDPGIRYRYKYTYSFDFLNRNVIATLEINKIRVYLKKVSDRRLQKFKKQSKKYQGKFKESFRSQIPKIYKKKKSNPKNIRANLKKVSNHRFQKFKKRKNVRANLKNNKKQKKRKAIQKILG